MGSIFVARWHTTVKNPYFCPLRARARAEPVNLGHAGHLVTKFDPTLLHFQKNLRRILQKLLISTLTRAVQFLDCFPHRRDMYQSRSGTPRAAPGLGKIPQILAKNPENPEVADLRASIFFFEGTYPPMTHTCLKSPFLGLSEYTMVTPPPTGRQERVIGRLLEKSS